MDYVATEKQHHHFDEQNFNLTWRERDVSLKIKNQFRRKFDIASKFQM